MKLWPFKKTEKRSYSLTDDFWFTKYPSGKASAGVSVSETTAMNYSVVFACVRILSETVAGLPLILYRKSKSGSKTRADNHPLYHILHDSPNSSMTAFRWRCALMHHIALWGNAFSEIKIDNRGNITGLWPLPPDRVVIRVSATKDGGMQPVYQYHDPITSVVRTIPNDRMLHISGMGYDGIQGYSPVPMHREAIGLGMAMQEFGSRFFGEGTHPSVIVEHPQKLSEAAHKNLTESLASSHSGLGKSHRLLVLEEGMKITPLGIPPEDAQFLESRQFQVIEICRIFRIPPHMVGDLTRATFSNIEHQSIEFVVHTVRPWLVLWEQELNRSLLLPGEQNEYYFEFLVDGLLRGDIKSRYDAYRVGREGGWLSSNDVRRMENMDPIKHGDDYLMPMNFQILGQPAPKPAAPTDKRSNPEKPVSTRTLHAASYSPDPMEKSVSRFTPLLRDAMEDILDREADVLLKAIQEHLAIRGADSFLSFMDSFYRDHHDYVKLRLGPVLERYAKSIQSVAAGMIGVDVGETSQMEDFLGRYLESYAFRHCRKGRIELESFLELETKDRILSTIESEIKDWVRSNAEDLAAEEAIRAKNAVSRELWRQHGVTKLKWVTSGSMSCPFCRKMNGRVVGIEDNFLSAGDVMHAGPDDHDGKGWLSLKIRNHKKHPPIHKGCVCRIRPAGGPGYKPVGFQSYGDFIHSRDSLPEKLRAFLSPLDNADYHRTRTKLFMADGKRSGYGITEDGELISVFSLPGAKLGVYSVDHAIDNGAKRLCCFDTGLVQFYESFGFREIKRIPWSDDYAPENWDYQRLGKPSVVYMEKDGANG